MGTDNFPPHINVNKLLEREDFNPKTSMQFSSKSWIDMKIITDLF